MISPDKMYYVKEETPLTYFKVLKVLMVIWIISSIIQMVGAPNVMSIVEHAVVVVLSIGALANFSDMKWTGVKFVYALLAFLTIDNLGGAIIFLSRWQPASVMDYCSMPPMYIFKKEGHCLLRLIRKKLQ